jgi:cell division protein FtsW (lipid II flippase)
MQIKNHLIILTIILGIILIFAAISFQWLLVCIIFAMFFLFLFINYLTNLLSSIQQNLEKIEQHLDAIRKSRP